MGKDLRLVFFNGRNIGSQLAGSPERACALLAAKRGIPARLLSAVKLSASDEAQTKCSWDSFFKSDWKEC